MSDKGDVVEVEAKRPPTPLPPLPAALQCSDMDGEGAEIDKSLPFVAEFQLNNTEEVRIFDLIKP